MANKPKNSDRTTEAQQSDDDDEMIIGTKRRRINKNKPRGGRPNKLITEDNIRQIEVMAGLGLRKEDICRVLGICKSTLWEKIQADEEIQEAMRRGEAKAAMQVTQSAFQQAISGKNPAMTMFWLKCRQRWREVHHVQITNEMVFRTRMGESGQMIQEVIDVDATKLLSQTEEYAGAKKVDE